MSETSRRSAARLSSFAVATLWHRRLDRTRTSAKVQPRVAAELILHPVISRGQPAEPLRSLPKDLLDAPHAA